MKRALELMSDGTGVTAAALELGYDSVSSFITAFCRTFGKMPVQQPAMPPYPPDD